MTSSIRRRDFIALVGGAAVGWPLTVRAQQPDNQVSASIDRILRMQADSIAEKVDEFIGDIQSHVDATARMPGSAADPNHRRFEFVRLLRQIPAITVIAQLDSAGREQALVSRIAADAFGSQIDYSQHPKFVEAMANKHYYGPIYLRRQSELYLTLSLAGPTPEHGVLVAEVNLKLIQDLVSSTRVGDRGVAYVVDAQDQVIAHPELSLIWRNVSALAHVRAARASGSSPLSTAQVTHDSNGREILAASTPIPQLGWLAIVELPVEEANALRPKE